jgi:hypothetical protein
MLLELDVILRQGSSFMQIVVTQGLSALQIVGVILDTTSIAFVV